MRDGRRQKNRKRDVFRLKEVEWVLHTRPFFHTVQCHAHVHIQPLVATPFPTITVMFDEPRPVLPQSEATSNQTRVRLRTRLQNNHCQVIL